MKKLQWLISGIALFSLSTLMAAAAPQGIGVVNFADCITQSKYGKYEQENLEKVRSQWSSMLEGTEKELKETSDKLQDQNYLDSISPEAEEQLKEKQQLLSEDMAKYQAQLYQVLNQANYFFVQKVSERISKASEGIAKDKNLAVILNKEACFYTAPNLDVTNAVISKMDSDFAKEQKTASNDAQNTNAKETAQK